MSVPIKNLICLVGVTLSFAVLGAEGMPPPSDGIDVSVKKRAVKTLRLQVIDPYADVHSGPGRGYPIFYAVEEGEFIEILARRPDWYEIRLSSGRTGWVTAAQISRSIQETGEPADLPNVSYGDYLKNSFQVGLTSGGYSSGELEGSNVWSATGGYRPISWVGIEAEYGKVYGEDIRGDFYSLNLMIEPLSHWRFSPYFIIGTGSIDIDSQPKLVPLDIEKSNFNNVGLGGNYYLGRNFLIKIEYRAFNVATDEKDVELGAWKIGFNTFF